MTAAALDSIRSTLAAGLLARSGGILVASILDVDSLASVAEEASALHSTAETYRVEAHDGEEHRGGEPDRWLESAVAGPRLRALYSSRGLTDLLAEVTGLRWSPSGGDGTYSYYRRPGHHLGLHRDVEECDLAVIVCVADDYEADPGLAGTLCLYPQRASEPLSAVRADSERGAVHIRARPGQAALLLGGIVPHRLVPVGPNHERVVAPLCFSVSRS
jgi:hypothetical protein